jgi:dihydrofolate reductase
MISIVAAIGENGELGANNKLIWKLPNDLKRFKKLTTEKIVVMGRKTFESLPNGPLPNRVNVVITRNSTPDHLLGCIFLNILDEITLLPRWTDKEIFIIGGGEIYKQTMKYCNKLYITRVHQTFENADTFFPKIDENVWKLIDEENFQSDEKHLYPYSFQTFKRTNEPT